MKCKPHELSGGEQQRVGLARALVNNPKIIIADEPTGNVDPDLSFEIVDLLSEINRRGTTVLMVTHEHDLVQHFHKRVIEIHGGVVVADTNVKKSAAALCKGEHRYQIRLNKNRIHSKMMICLMMIIEKTMQANKLHIQTLIIRKC